jgi:hypothetical protein
MKLPFSSNYFSKKSLDFFEKCANINKLNILQILSVSLTS